MLAPVYRLLVASPDVTAITDVIGAFGAVDPNESRPYVVWQIVGGGADVALDDNHICADRHTIQLDCVADTQTIALALAEACRGALLRDAVYLAAVAVDRDDVTRKYRVAVRFDFILT